MALQRTFVKYGTTFPTAYSRIRASQYVSEYKDVVVHGELDTTDPSNPVPTTPTVTSVKKKVVQCTLATYVSKDSFDNKEEPVDVNMYAYEVPSDETEENVHVVIYNHLKTLPEFDGAIDV